MVFISGVSLVTNIAFIIVFATDASISLTCEYLDVSENQGYVEACAILNEGELKIAVAVAMSTTFDTADSK